MKYQKVTEQFIKSLIEICGSAYVNTTTGILDDYSHDYTEDLRYRPEVVVKPSNAREISHIIKLCNEHHVPATPRGAGTGLSGGALPVFGGVIISMERFNKII